MQTDEATDFDPIRVPQIGPLCTLNEKNIAELYPRWSQNLSWSSTKGQILANEIGIGNLFKGKLVKTVTIKCSSYKINMKY